MASSSVLSNIDHIESLVETFMVIYESSMSILKTLNNEKIKKAFQISSLIEKLVGSYKDENKMDVLSNLFEIILMNKNFHPKHDTDFFMKACDRMLEKFFMLSEAFFSQTDVAVRIYTSLLPPQRFNAFLLDLMVESASNRAIQEFIFENENVDIKTIHFKLVIQDWIPEFQAGRHKELTKVIQGMMSPYDSKKTLHILVGVIAVETDSDDESQVRELVHKEVLQKMYSRGKLSKDFWLSLFAVDPDLTMRACQMSQHFHASLCKFLIFVGSMMDMKEEEGEMKWVPMSTSNYPELIYEFLVEEFRKLSDVKFCRRDVTMKIILKAEEETNCALWKQLLDVI